MSLRVGGKRGRVSAQSCNLARLSLKNQNMDGMAGHIQRNGMSSTCRQDQLFDKGQTKTYNSGQLPPVQKKVFSDFLTSPRGPPSLWYKLLCVRM